MVFMIENICYCFARLCHNMGIKCQAMTKKELKSIIKECVREIIFEDGALSTVVSEVIKGLSQNRLIENKQPISAKKNLQTEHTNFKRKINDTRKKLLDSIGREAYGGVNVFEGTAPLSERQAQGSDVSGPLDNIHPCDPSIDITKIPGMSNWKHLIK